MTDAACLYSALTLSAAHESTCDLKEIEHRQLKIAAIQLINDKLRNIGDGIGDAAIGAIAVLAASEVRHPHE